ncbi:hypothetical protein J4466_02235 [Candidatus Pacearchaeota archaeon]|nr:hypothetical protein [Candidatus Pacearchaeota archaeon]
MRGKRGFLRILEAFIAILIIAGAMTFIYVREIPEKNQREDILNLERIILESITNDDQLRQAVLDGFGTSETAEGNRTLINSTIAKLVPQGYTFIFKICELNEICGLDQRSNFYTENEIYSERSSVSSTREEYDPKKIRLFMWEKN